MLIFLDSGDIEEMIPLVQLFKIDGITTNPKLTTIDHAIRIMEILKLPTSIQMDVGNPQIAINRAKVIHEQNKLAVIKMPINHLELGRSIINMSIPVNFTLCFNLAQVIAATNVGADYASLFIGRMLDHGRDAMQILKNAVDYIDRNDCKTKIIAASIRTPEHFELAAIAGAHIVTISPAVLLKITNDVLTDSGLIDFAKHSVSLE